MKFNINKISSKDIAASFNIIKDFGFLGYYPLISNKSWDIIKGQKNNYSVYIENLYDKLIDNDLYEKEGEKLIIYIYPINKNEFEISNISYINNLLTKKNKVNFEIIPSNNNGALILNLYKMYYKYYQFDICKNKEIKFKIESSNGELKDIYPKYEYPLEVIINETKQFDFNSLSQNEILIHKFESNNEFLFSFTFNKWLENPFENYSILSAFEVQKNILQIKFEILSDYLENYYILIAKKDDKNNIESFSDRCYISKLFINNDFNSIIVKSINKIKDKSYKYLFDIFDISELKLEDNRELLVTVVSYYPGDIIKFYTPFYTNSNIAQEIKLDEQINFNTKKNTIFSFEFKPKLAGKEQKLSIMFTVSTSSIIAIYLTSNYTDKREFFGYAYNKIDFTLTNPGKYYLEIYKSFEYYTEDSEGTFIALLREKLIDIINLNKKVYKNKNIITLSLEVEPNYYIVTNLTKNKMVNFTFKSIDESFGYQNPFIVCNNNTNLCSFNVKSYTFKEGVNYTIFIKNLWGYDTNRTFHYYYYFTSYNLSVYNIKEDGTYAEEEEIEEEENDDNKGNKGEDTKENDGLNNTTLALIISGGIFGFIIIVLSIFFTIRYIKKKNQNIDFNKKTNEISNENLII